MSIKKWLLICTVTSSDGFRWPYAVAMFSTKKAAVKYQNLYYKNRADYSVVKGTTNGQPIHPATPTIH